ncbi:hypothetical protein H8K20_08060 [Neobittarella massiliensis]|uniref:Uncharacterized protein n=1 Tax=Neobittarella massiliensis (ex Bilen et al. 2018) TaxID=2041842 RepID=A0A8J6LU73_9FIRM|nr:hypothetical protein [Neobittarella massiliensis]MBC3516349.1 hypothetical protein [Neobittarella massiliensis]
MKNTTKTIAIFMLIAAAVFAFFSLTRCSLSNKVVGDSFNLQKGQFLEMYNQKIPEQLDKFKEKDGAITARGVELLLHTGGKQKLVDKVELRGPYGSDSEGETFAGYLSILLVACDDTVKEEELKELIEGLELAKVKEQDQIEASTTLNSRKYTFVLRDKQASLTVVPVK